MSRKVQTPYGPLPGCPDCDVLVFPGGEHVCEHGVTVVPPIAASFTVTFEDPDMWRRLTGRDP